ncbi:unnamed protein product [Urochloa humidicola]
MDPEEEAVAAVAEEVGVVAMGDQAMGPGQGTVREAAVEVLLVGMDMAAEAVAVRVVVLAALGMGLARALAMGLAVVVPVGMEVVEAAEAVVAKVVVQAMAMEVVRGMALALAPAMEVVLAVVVVAVDTVAAAVAAKVGLAMALAPDTDQVKGMDRVELMEEAMAAAVVVAVAAAKVVVALAMAPVLVLATALVVDTTKLNFRTDYRVYCCKCVIISVVSLSPCLQESAYLSVCNTKSMLDTIHVILSYLPCRFM